MPENVFNTPIATVKVQSVELKGRKVKEISMSDHKLNGNRFFQMSLHFGSIQHSGLTESNCEGHDQGSRLVIGVLPPGLGQEVVLHPHGDEGRREGVFGGLDGEVVLVAVDVFAEEGGHGVDGVGVGEGNVLGGLDGVGVGEGLQRVGVGDDEGEGEVEADEVVTALKELSVGGVFDVKTVHKGRIRGTMLISQSEQRTDKALAENK